MTDYELLQQAKEHMRRATVKFSTWEANVKAGKYADVSKTEWGKATGLLDQIAPAPTPPPTEAWEAWTLNMPASTTNTHGWVKSVRGTDDQGILQFSDYPDGFWLVHKVRFDQGAPGAWLDLHVTPPWGEFPYVSPIRLDYHGGRPGGSPPDIVPGLILALEAEMNAGRRGHFQVLTEAEINADRTVVWTVETFVRPGQSPSGEIKVNLKRNGQPFRLVWTPNVSTVYAGMGRIYVWQGAYQSNGVGTNVRVTTTLDRRGRTLTEAYADRPVLGEVNKQPAVTLTGTSL